MSARSTRPGEQQQRDLADERALRSAFGSLGLSAAATRYAEGRFLPYAEFCEGQAKRWRLGYYWLRIPAIILAAVVPALVAANLGSTGRWIATALGVTVATLSAVEHFLDAGGRWRHYRGSVERLKSEAWAYVALTTPYSGCRDHDHALGRFVDQVERVIKGDVEDYVALVNTDTQHPDAGQQASASTTGAPPAITG